MKNITIPSLVDFFPIAATLFIQNPASETTSNHSPYGISVVVAGATGIARRFYQRFSLFLIQNLPPPNSSVVTFDYRGIGDSFPGNNRRDARDIEANISDHWANRDLAGVLDFVSKNFPRNRIVFVGHSVGIHSLAFLPPNLCQRIDRVLSVSCQNAYWKHRKLDPKSVLYSRPWRVYLTYFFVIPMLTRIFGKFPGRRLGMFEDLPKGVALQWFFFCRFEKYCVDQNGKQVRTGALDSLECPILSYSADDDEFAGPEAFEQFHSFFSKANPVRFVHILPIRDLHGSRLGHNGFFKDSEVNRKALWTPALEYILTGKMPENAKKSTLSSNTTSSNKKIPVLDSSL